MLRREIVEGFQAVFDAIRGSAILEMMKFLLERPGRKKEEEEAVPGLVESFRKWTRASEKFSPSARAVARILELGFLDDDGFWERILGRESDERARTVSQFYYRVSFFVNQVPKLIELLKRDVDQYALAEAPAAEAKHAILSVIVLEEKGYSSPARISGLMSGIELLYEACAQLEGISTLDLCLISCDAGSDKSFDFLGVAKLIEQVRKIILDLWDRVIFFRERKLTTHLELLSNSLPLIEKITSLEESKKLGPEQAEKLRRNVVEGVRRFLESGAAIPEMEKVSSFSPRQLLAPEPKLLVSPVDYPPAEQKQAGPSDGQKGSGVREDPELRNYVERVTKELLQREKFAETHRDSDEDAGRFERGAQDTDPRDKE